MIAKELYREDEVELISDKNKHDKIDTSMFSSPKHTHKFTHNKNRLLALDYPTLLWRLKGMLLMMFVAVLGHAISW